MENWKRSLSFVFWLLLTVCASYGQAAKKTPTAALVPIPKVLFNSFVDCNMAEVWVGDTFRIFPGKYGEDPVWGTARDLKFTDGANADEAFRAGPESFKEPALPVNALPGTTGLHGAIWFETVYQDVKDESGKTLFAIYHNENYPATLPFNPATGEGYKNINWPQGLKGPSSATAVCRIGIMKSIDGGHSWINKGIFIEDLQPRLILKPHNNGINFAGGVGDPSAVASGEYLYLFYGEYGYPGVYSRDSYSRKTEYTGQCISVARIRLSDLDAPVGKAKRWDGKAFNGLYNGIGKPIESLQIPVASGGGPASSSKSKYYWGPSVSWNTYLQCWVMLMAKAEGPSWTGSSIYISFNTHRELSEGRNSQLWTKPQLLVNKPGHVLWYPSLQPLNNPDDIANRNTSLKLGQKARLFFKDNFDNKGEYLSEYIVQFMKE